MSIRHALFALTAFTMASSPALAQKGPANAATLEDPVNGITLDEVSETGPNAVTLGGITARVESMPGADETLLPVFIVEDASGEVLRFEGELSFFSFLPVTLRLVQMDPTSPEPEVIATSYTGGAHCCERMQIAAIQPDGSWAMSEMGLFDGGYSVYDADEDGFGEIEVADQSFLYTFDCYACSYPPPLFYTIVEGQAVNISDDPDLYPVFAGALTGFEDIQTMSDQPGRVAGWTAIRARLGEGEQALLEIEALNIATSTTYDICTTGGSSYDCPANSTRQVGFAEFLRIHLVEQGYMTGASVPGGKG